MWPRAWTKKINTAQCLILLYVQPAAMKQKVNGRLTEMERFYLSVLLHVNKFYFTSSEGLSALKQAVHLE